MIIIIINGTHTQIKSFFFRIDIDNNNNVTTLVLFMPQQPKFFANS